MQRLTLPVFMGRMILDDRVQLSKMHANRVLLIQGKADKHFGRLSRIEAVRNAANREALMARGLFS